MAKLEVELSDVTSLLLRQRTERTGESDAEVVEQVLGRARGSESAPHAGRAERLRGLLAAYAHSDDRVKDETTHRSDTIGERAFRVFFCLLAAAMSLISQHFEIKQLVLDTSIVLALGIGGALWLPKAGKGAHWLAVALLAAVGALVYRGQFFEVAMLAAAFSGLSLWRRLVSEAMPNNPFSSAFRYVISFTIAFLVFIPIRVAAENHILGVMLCAAVTAGAFPGYFGGDGTSLQK